MKALHYAFAGAAIASAAAAAPVSHRYAIGGVPVERTSVTFVDLANLQRTGEAVRAPLLLVQRDVRVVGGKPVLYSSMDVVFDCKAMTMGLAEVKTFTAQGEMIDDIPTPGPKMALAPGSSFAASAEVACSGKPRAADAPNFATDKLAVDYAQRLLHGERPTDRAL